MKPAVNLTPERNEQASVYRRRLNAVYGSIYYMAQANHEAIYPSSVTSNNTQPEPTTRYDLETPTMPSAQPAETLTQTTTQAAHIQAALQEVDRVYKESDGQLSA